MRRWQPAVVLAAVALIVVLVGRLLVERNNDNDAAGVGDKAGLTLLPFAKTAWSPDTSRLAMVSDGELTVVAVRDGEPIARHGGNIVDAAWMPDGGRVLVTEGPNPTGEVAVIQMNGQVSGVAHLSPSIAFGDGLGLSVDSNGSHAAAIAVTREPIGGLRHTDLAIIDLGTGAVRVIETPSANESQPVFLDDDTVAVAVADASSAAAHLRVVDLLSGDTKDRGAILSGPYVASPGGDPVVVVASPSDPTRTSVVTVDRITGDHRPIGELEPGHLVNSIDTKLTRAIVNVFVNNDVERTILERLN